MATLVATPQALAKLTPEQESAALAKKLKPIPTDQWKTIAGTRIQEQYTITRADTLYDISKRLLAMRNMGLNLGAETTGSITNPHLIRPGNASRSCLAPGPPSRA